MLEVALILGLILAARLPLASIKVYLKIIVPVILIFFALFLVLERRGEPIFALGPLPITSLGVAEGIVAGMRLAALFFSTIGMLLTTTRERELVLGMTKVKLPYGIALLFMMTLRFITMSMSDLETIRQARRARGTPERESGFRLAWNLRSLLIPLFLATIRRIQISANALEVRGFAPGTHRGSYYEERLASAEVVFISALVAILVVLTLLRVFFGLLVSV
jgi:energy-coupling factor transport system permease protein